MPLSRQILLRRARRLRRLLLVPALALLALVPCLAPAAAAEPAGGAPAARAPAAAAPVVVTLETSMGRIVLELDAQKAPHTVANFVQYVKEGFYDGTVFHRVIPGFMIQGGGYAGGLQHKETHAPIAIESNNGLHNERGTIAMARTSDPNSATSQFFINVADNAPLDYPGSDGYGYTVFGKVVEGMEVADAIVAVPTKARGFEFQNLPVKAVFLQKARLGK
jgi:peptidyl-prolyl cis-trans isomerase A (cyclophilin A)